MNEVLFERLALEAGMFRSTKLLDTRWLATNEELAKFAALVAEECAKECGAYAAQSMGASCDGAFGSAAAIRAKFPAP